MRDGVGDPGEDKGERCLHGEVLVAVVELERLEDDEVRVRVRVNVRANVRVNVRVIRAGAGAVVRAGTSAGARGRASLEDDGGEQARTEADEDRTWLG